MKHLPISRAPIPPPLHHILPFHTSSKIPLTYDQKFPNFKKSPARDQKFPTSKIPQLVTSLHLLIAPPRLRPNGSPYTTSVRLAVGKPGIHFSSRVIPKDFKNGIYRLALSKIGIVWRTSRQACSLYP